MRISTDIELVDRPEDRAQLVIRVELDGERCGDIVLVSGPKRDLQQYVAGDITLHDLRVRWSPRL